MSFAAFLFRKEPADHATDCYFYMVPPTDKTVKEKKCARQYPNISSYLRLLPRNERCNSKKDRNHIKLSRIMGKVMKPQIMNHQLHIT